MQALFPLLCRAPCLSLAMTSSEQRLGTFYLRAWSRHVGTQHRFQTSLASMVRKSLSTCIRDGVLIALLARQCASRCSPGYSLRSRCICRCFRRSKVVVVLACNRQLACPRSGGALRKNRITCSNRKTVVIATIKILAMITKIRIIIFIIKTCSSND